MVGILLITHAPLGQAFVAALTHIFRERPAQLEVLDVIADQDTEQVAQLAQAALTRLDTGTGVLVVTDLIGATPANCAGALRLEAPNIEVIAGVSLPMLLRAISYRDNTLDVVSEMALSGGHAGAARLDPRVRLSS